MFPTLFSLEIPFLDLTLEPRFYGLFYAIAILIGSRIVLSEVQRRELGLSDDDAMNLTLYAFLVGLLGARTYEIVMEWSNYYAHQPFWKVFAVWQGGLAIHGGIIGGSLYTIFYCRRKRISQAHFLDIAALCTPISSPRVFAHGPPEVPMGAIAAMCWISRNAPS